MYKDNNNSRVFQFKIELYLNFLRQFTFITINLIDLLGKCKDRVNLNKEDLVYVC